VGPIGTPLARAHGTYAAHCEYGCSIAREHNPEGRWTGVLTSSQAGFTMTAAARAAPPAGATEEVARLIERLASSSFEEREAATAALRALGEGARGALEAAVEHADPEVCARVQGLLHEIDRPFEFPPGFTLEISRNISSGKPNPTWTVSGAADLCEIFWRLRGLSKIPSEGWAMPSRGGFSLEAHHDGFQEGFCVHGGVISTYGNPVEIHYGDVQGLEAWLNARLDRFED
jgi:hypothetical protein